MDDKLKAKIMDEYQRGTHAIVNIARINNVEVDDVLSVINEDSIKEVTFGGDLIDDAGPDVQVNRKGRTYKQKFTKN